LFVIAMVLFSAGGCYLYIISPYNPIYYKNVAEQFRQRMQNQANIPEIQAWMAERKESMKKENEDVPQEEWPDSIKKLEPHDFRVWWHGKSLEIVTGGGFGHWGMRVNAPGTPTPE